MNMGGREFWKSILYILSGLSFFTLSIMKYFKIRTGLYIVVAVIIVTTILSLCLGNRSSGKKLPIRICNIVGSAAYILAVIILLISK